MLMPGALTHAPRCLARYTEQVYTSGIISHYEQYAQCYRAERLFIFPHLHSQVSGRSLTNRRNHEAEHLGSQYGIWTHTAWV